MMIISKSREVEHCIVCNRSIPENRPVIRHSETGKIICVICLVEVADLKQKKNGS